MTHWYKYFIWLLIPIVFGCGSNSSDNTQNDTEDEGFHLQISNVGDINGVGIQDSVVLCDSLVTSNKKEMTASKMSVIDNDTMLKMEAVNENGTSVKLCFMKKGLSQKVINAIKHDFLNPNLRKREYRYNYSNISDRELSEDTSLEDVFYKNKELLGNMKLKGFEEDETYRIMPVYENDHFVTYLFEYESFDCRVCYYTYFITYDKKTGKSFSWDMIRKNDDFRSLLMSYISKEKDIEEGRFKYSECPPYIGRDDSLCICYQRYEITDDYCFEGCPEAIIPLNEIEPFLTKEGKKFLRR